jgi:hypothetical protein
VVKVFIVVFLGITTSILIHGDWLFIDNEVWTSTLVDSSVFSYMAKNYHEGWSYALISSWFILPLLLPFVVLLAVFISKLNQSRLFIYTLLATSTFIFLILPRLPIFDILLSGLGSYMNVIYNRITPLALCLLIFYLSISVIKKYNKQINQDK